VWFGGTKPSAVAATATAQAAAATGGTANIMIYGVNTDGAYWHAIVSGVIGDYGPTVCPGAFRAQLITVAGSATISF
jgi:hypothetical protein